MPIGHRWRSSTAFLISTISIALFAETFLYGFLVPILRYILEGRLQLDHSQTQRLTSVVLSLYGLVSVISSPAIGHFADKLPNRKTPLLVSLAGCIVGTIMVACASSLAILLLGRMLQAAAGSGVWILCLATVADNVEEDRMGTVMGIVMSFVNAGVVAGPMVSGLLLENVGYWMAWLVPLVVLMADMIARSLMIELPKKSYSKSTEEPTESSNLLPPLDISYSTSTAFGFWRFILRNGRVVTSMLIAISSSCVSSSFQTTLPLHVQEVFGWGTGHVGMMFFCLSAPGIFISPLSGWIRDRVGVKYPAAIALLIQAIVLCVLGAAGNGHIFGDVSKTSGPVVYTIAIVVMGTMRPFVSGIAAVEVVSVVKEYQANDPGIFGKGGGFSRVFAMIDISSTFGLTIGPIISGYLCEQYSYVLMNCTLGALYLMLTVLALYFLKSNVKSASLLS